MKKTIENKKKKREMWANMVGTATMLVVMLGLFGVGFPGIKERRIAGIELASIRREQHAGTVRQIVLRLPNGRITLMDVENPITIDALRDQIWRAEGVPPLSQRLMYQGRDLTCSAGNERSFSIRAGSTVSLSLRLKGGSKESKPGNSAEVAEDIDEMVGSEELVYGHMLDRALSRTLGISIRSMGGSHRPGQGNTPKELDPIQVAGSIKLNEIRAMARELRDVYRGGEMHWLDLLMQFIDDDTPAMELLKVDEQHRRESAAGQRRSHQNDAMKPRAAGTPQRVSGHYRRNMQKLEEAHVVRRWQAANEKEKRPEVTVGYFQVEKDAQWDRAIWNAKWLNQRFAQPRKVRLLDVSTLLALMGTFEDPYVATADLRHFFYQIPLPKSLLNAFIVGAGEDWLGALNVLPMGWNWSPWVAQGVATVIMISTLYHKGYVVEAWDPDVSAPSSFYIVKKKNSEERLAFLSVYYDNFTIIAKNEGVRDEIVAIIVANAERANAKFKKNAGKPEPDAGAAASTKTAPEGFTLTKNQAQVFGVDIRIVGAMMKWNHTAKTRARWENTLSLIPDGDTEVHTMRLLDLAIVCGRLVWDMTVRNWVRSDLNGPLKILSDAYLVCYNAGQGGLHWKSAVVKLSRDDVATLREATERMLANAEEVGHRRKPLNHIVVATDSSDAQYGFVWVCPEKRQRSGAAWSDFRPAWSKEEPSDWTTRHINVKELVAGVLAMKAAAAECKNVQLWLAMDNTTAIAWLTHRWCPTAEVSEWMRETLIELQERGISVHPFYVHTTIMPADAISRGHREVPSKGSVEEKEEKRRIAETIMRLEVVKKLSEFRRPREMASPMTRGGDGRKIKRGRAAEEDVSGEAPS